MRPRFILTRITALSFTVLFVATAGWVAYGRFVSKPTPLPETAPAAVVANHAAQAEADDLEVELITVRPEGFEPLEIIRQKGPFVLLVDDRSGTETSSLQLRQLKGERLRDLNTNRKKAEWYELVNLPPGKYVLTDAANPERRCQITILP